MDRCDHCGTRLSGDDDRFSHRDHDFCCECMAVLCSWYFEGGRAENPDQFGYLNSATGVK